MNDVKTPPRATLSRRDRARATRARIIRAAYGRFCELGYAGTTMADVAQLAGVAVQTVYFTFHTKAELLAGAYEYAVMGDVDPRPPAMQPWYTAAREEPDVHRAVEILSAGATEIVVRAAPLETVVRATASSDPEAAAVWAYHEKLRKDGYRGMVELLAAKAPLADGMSLERATDLLLLYLGPHPYRGLVVDHGWAVEAWLAWAAESVDRELFGGSGSAIEAARSGRIARNPNRPSRA
jgi:AcrR family transcriptional regulator